MNQSTFFTTAMKAIAKRTPVFPCGAGLKTPMPGSHGFHDATTDENVVRQWAEKWPTANVGVPTGERSGLVVLDVDIDADSGKDGEAALAELVAKHGALPITLEVRTPRGGRHIYFRHPGQPIPSRTNHPAPAMDIRGDGGYVLIPPSRTERGEYTNITRSPPADMPAWLLSLLTAATVPVADKPAQTVVRDTPLYQPEIQEGRIRDALRHIPASDYSTWTTMGMAIHSEMPDAHGLAIWDDWSKSCPAKYDEQVMHKKWASFKGVRSGGVTLGTLFEYAKRGGWTPAAAHRPELHVSAAALAPLAEQIELEPVAGYVPFVVDALPERFRALVSHGAESIGCDPALVALPLLAAAAGAIGNSRRIMLKQGWTEPAVLWAVTVAMSGDRKSPAFDLGTDGLTQIEDRAYSQYRAALDAFKRDLKRWKDQGSEGEKPEAPAADRYIVRDVTIEGLAPVLSENPRGLLLARDELSAWVGGFDKYSGKGEESAHWLEFYRAGRVTVDRKSGDVKTVHVPRAAVSVTGTIQPGTLKRVLARQHFDNGLAARLLLAWPPRQLHQWNESQIDAASLIPVREVFDRLAAMQMGTDNFGTPTPVDLVLTEEGKARWVDFYNQHAREALALGDERLASAWSKLEGIAARLALIIHCVRVASQDASVQDEFAVDATSIDAAIRLVTWFKNETKRIYGWLAESEDTRDARKVLECIHAKGGRATARDVARSGVCNGDADRIDKIMSVLEKIGRGVWHEVPSTIRGGRPTRCFELIRETSETSETPSYVHS